MSWIDKILPPRINRSSDGARRVPEGLWVKCPSCESVLYKEDLKATLNVCPKCSHHMRLGARDRIDALLDADGRVEIGENTRPMDPLKFKDSRKYPERVAEATKQTGEGEAMVVMSGAILAVPVVLACFEFSFMGGSMGSVVGERFVRGVREAIKNRTPFICVAASGGARMQESLFSLMQMAKTNAMLTRLSAEGLPFRSDHGGRVGQLCLHGRCGHRGAQGAHWLRRPARDRADRARKAAGRLSAGRIPA
jgi:acetyl-CoA carboxylase carboxyl transferase subunit beta